MTLGIIIKIAIIWLVLFLAIGVAAKMSEDSAY
jgi:hypothetical protein